MQARLDALKSAIWPHTEETRNEVRAQSPQWEQGQSPGWESEAFTLHFFRDQ